MDRSGIYEGIFIQIKYLQNVVKVYYKDKEACI